MKQHIKILIALVATILQITVVAQNILYVKNTEGTVNKECAISLGIDNSESFISFQCDVVLPEGFSYVSESIALSNRSTDHVISATNVSNDTLRILSYSLNNAQFLGDTGVIATFKVTTPNEVGDYLIRLKNGIIGDDESTNIIDSLVNGNVVLKPLGINNPEKPDIDINVYPNPFGRVLNIRINKQDINWIEINTYSANGTLIRHLRKTSNQNGAFSIQFNPDELLGRTATNGVYYIHFQYKKRNKIYSMVKKIIYKKP